MVIASGGPATYDLLFSSTSHPSPIQCPVFGGRYHIVVPNSATRKSLKEFVAFAKANPGKINWASPGIGSSPHLAGEFFKRAAGIEITHVPYRGVAAGAMSDLIAGRLDAMFNTTGSLLQAVRGNQVRGLAVTTAERFGTAPGISTVAEAGVSGYDVKSWYGMWVPAGSHAR